MDGQARAIKAALTDWFESRPPREQKLLIVGGALLLVLIVYNVLWTPAYDGRERIAASLPDLEAQVAEVRQQVDEVRGLKAAAALQPPAGAALRDALAGSLAQAGIAAPQISSIGDGVQIEAKNVPFGAWMSWLDQVRRDDHVRVVDAHASAEAQAGHATVSVTLQPAAQP
jgi:general secretion pathway protein M